MDYLLEDSQDHTAKVLLSSFKHGLSDLNNETGGFFYLNDQNNNFCFYPLKNEGSFFPDLFNSKNDFFYNQYLKNNIISLFHTHLSEDPRPGPCDISMAESFALPSFILSTASKNTYLHYPKNYKPRSLSQRIFIPYFQDCLSYVKDFYLLNLNINLHNTNINWSRRKDNNNEDMLSHIQDYFFIVDKKEMKDGDLIVFEPTISRFMHLGVYFNKMMFHHPIYSFPKKEVIVDGLLNKVYNIYRYKDS